MFLATVGHFKLYVATNTSVNAIIARLEQENKELKKENERYKSAIGKISMVILDREAYTLIPIDDEMKIMNIINEVIGNEMDR